MRGLMQDRPLALPHVFHRAEQLFGHKPIVTATADGEVATTVAEWAVRVRRLADGARLGRHLGRRAGGHVRLEHRTPPGAVSRDPGHRPGDAHAEHPVLPRARDLHGRPRAGRSVFVDRSLLPCSARTAPRSTAARDRDGRRRDAASRTTRASATRT